MKQQLFIGVIASALALGPAWAAGDKEQTGKSDEAAPMAGTTVPSTGAGGSGTGETGRDWTKVDADRDNSVSAEEMEAWLQANPGPLKK